MTETPTEREGRGGLQSQRGDTQSGKKAEDRRLQTGMASSSGTSWKVGRAKVGGPGAAPGSHRPRREGRGPESESVISPGPVLDPTTTSRPDFPGVPLKGMETGRVGAQAVAQHSHHSAAEPALSSTLPSASVQQADIDPAQPSSIPAAFSPLCSSPTKKRRGLSRRAAPARILCRINPREPGRGRRTRPSRALSRRTWSGSLRQGVARVTPSPASCSEREARGENLC